MGRPRSNLVISRGGWALHDGQFPEMAHPRARAARQARHARQDTGRQSGAIGLIMAYGASISDLYRRAAAYLDKIPRGTTSAFVANHRT